jgi:hypothetical protein
MARTRKSIQPLNLYKYDVLIDDKGTRSDYFKLSQFDGYFYGGRNAFLVGGAGVLHPNSKILVEILNKNNDTIYSAPVPSFVEGNSRLIQIEVYSDTPIGPGKIVILGCADSYIDGTPIPPEWRDKYNIRWISDVIISPLIPNKTPIRFAKTPSMVVEEKFYFAPSASAFNQSSLAPTNIQITPKYFNVFPNGYLLQLKGPADTRYYSKYLGAVLTGSIAFSNDTITQTASIQLPITKIYNKSLAESEGSLIYTNNKTILLDGFFSGSGSYLANVSPFGEVRATSSLNIQYNQLDVIDIGNRISFAKLRLVDLSTISGEIHKIRIAYKPTTEPGEYVLLGDVTTKVEELLAVDSGSRISETGKFKDIVINDYWYSATMSLQRNESSPTLPAYYTSSNLIPTTSLAITQCCDYLLDSVNATPAIINNTFINNVSYFIGTRNSNVAKLFPRSEYTLSFQALVSRASASINLSQSDYSLQVYLVDQGNNPSLLLEKNSRGQLLGTLTPESTFEKQNFETVEFNFVPKIIKSGNFGLRFVVYGGAWNIANVSLKTAEEVLFSSDEVDILLPNVNYADKILTFKADYLDINNNSVGVSTTAIPIYFTGSESAISTGGSSVTIGVSPPISPGIGDLWWNSEEGQLKIYYFDGDSFQWVDASGESIETGSFGSSAISSSYALTASYALNGGSGGGGSGIFASSSISSSWASSSISSSYALTSSYALNDFSFVYVFGDSNGQPQIDMISPYNGTFNNWYSRLNVSGSVTMSVSRSAGITSTLTGVTNASIKFGTTIGSQSLASGWSPSSFNTGDIISVKVDNIATASQATFTLVCRRT